MKPNELEKGASVRLSIRLKLFVSIFLALLVTIFLLMSLVKFKVEHGFMHYVGEKDKALLVQLTQDLSRYYEDHGQFSVLVDQHAWQSLVAGAVHFPSPVTVDTHFSRLEWLSKRIVLLDDQQHVIQGVMPDSRSMPVLVPIRVKQRTVGYVAMPVRQGIGEKLEHEFNQEFMRNLGWIAAVTLFVALVLAWFLSRHFGDPIQALRKASQSLSQGRYATRVPVMGSDELTALAKDMNALAERLETNETTRKRWVADIAHELRTPLTILKGEVEALQDGITRPDEAKFKSLHDEVTQLQRLVDDLYQLSMSDSGALAYVMRPVDLVAVVRDVMASYAVIFAERQLVLTSIVPFPTVCRVMADEQRLKQLLNNLFENTLRYTDVGGCLQVSVSMTETVATLMLDDSSPSVPEESMVYLFDRLYRVEASRNRETGGAGLGLSICQAIAVAHHGELHAMPSPLGGLRITLALPRIQE